MTAFSSQSAALGPLLRSTLTPDFRIRQGINAENLTTWRLELRAIGPIPRLGTGGRGPRAVSRPGPTPPSTTDGARAHRRARAGARETRWWRAHEWQPRRQPTAAAPGRAGRRAWRAGRPATRQAWHRPGREPGAGGLEGWRAGGLEGWRAAGVGERRRTGSRENAGGRVLALALVSRPLQELLLLVLPHLLAALLDHAAHGHLSERRGKTGSYRVVCPPSSAGAGLRLAGDPAQRRPAVGRLAAEALAGPP